VFLMFRGRIVLLIVDCRCLMVLSSGLFCDWFFMRG